MALLALRWILNVTPAWLTHTHALSQEEEEEEENQTHSFPLNRTYPPSLIHDLSEQRSCCLPLTERCPTTAEY